MTTVIGGGLAGLVAAITVAEGGGRARLLESHQVLGGRARTTTGEFRANLGPHALYKPGPLWSWLAERDLIGPCAAPQLTGIRVRHQGRLWRKPPFGLVGLARYRSREAPVDRTFRDWIASLSGPETARLASNAAGVFTFDADPGRLSAAFVWERLVRVAYTFPAAAHYPVGGWQPMVDRIAAHARRVGVEIECGVTVASLDDVTARASGGGGPVIIATEPRTTYRLLGRESPPTTGPRTALLDVGLRAHRRDPFIVSDLDEGAWLERFSANDPSLAPERHSLIQLQCGLRDGETLDAGVARLERLLDDSCEGWRGREVWRRRSLLNGRTGAVDVPGQTWRDREPIDQGDGVLVCGDWVAAPGLLAEVSHASAVEAARAALSARVRSPRRVA